MALEIQQIDTLKTKLSQGITIERWNGISQQLAVAMGINIQKEKLDIHTRKLLRDLSQIVSADTHALMPKRVSIKKYGYKAVHSVREGDIIRLDDEKINTLLEKYKEKISKNPDKIRGFTQDDIAIRPNGFMQKMHEMLVTNGFQESADNTYTDGVFQVSLDDQRNLVYKKIEKTIESQKDIKDTPIEGFTRKAHDFLIQENGFSLDDTTSSYMQWDFRISFDGKKLISNKNPKNLTDREKLYLLTAQQYIL